MGYVDVHCPTGPAVCVHPVHPVCVHHVLPTLCFYTFAGISLVDESKSEETHSDPSLPSGLKYAYDLPGGDDNPSRNTDDQV